MNNFKPNPGRTIAQHIAAIRSVLQTNGYALRKQPRQAVWFVYGDQDKSYRLTYQPAPIGAWVLHPPDKQAQRLSRLIQDAVTHSQPGSTSDPPILPQPCDNSRPWAIVLLSEANQRRIVARFHHQQDAEDRLRAMRRFVPKQQFEVIFNPPEPRFTGQIVDR